MSLSLHIDELELWDIQLTGRDDLGQVIGEELRRLMLLSGTSFDFPDGQINIDWESLEITLPAKATRWEAGSRIARAIHRQLCDNHYQRHIMEDWGASGSAPTEGTNVIETRRTHRAQPTTRTGSHQISIQPGVGEPHHEGSDLR